MIPAVTRLVAEIARSAKALGISVTPSYAVGLTGQRLVAVDHHPHDAGGIQPELDALIKQANS